MTKALSPGNIFGVPLPDGSRALGQVLSIESDAMNSVGCVFFGARAALPSSISGELLPIAILLVTPDLLKSRAWPVLASAPPAIAVEDTPYNDLRSQGWVGAKIIGSAIISEFLAAFHGMAPWDDWHDPEYLDTLLLPGVSRPSTVVLLDAPNNSFKGKPLRGSP